ncbi:kinesin-like protein Klp61F [Pectinophora gossypiella]|uniref:kinesin-like protein Klp61F n=1 Tax=Pectinophora gossypiella TaxID=13191 RepID=UPI00214EC115|nr:kinesin-like protein Klp61F [Pectinophora gossypiella]
MATVDRSIKKEKNQNIQVFVRLRPLNHREKAIRSHGVVEVVNNREVVVRQSHQSSHTKRFTFDRAFGPNVQQVEVYKEVVSPLIAEVLAGYNCTVFAYGQTGTGKTHTMVGENSGEGTTWQNDPLAGIIPRALSQLFDELRISNTEYNVRVSYLELYNEELCDLLSPSMDNSKLRIYEDVNRKGSTIVNGLEEITVYNKNEVYEIMARGQERKKVASTLMNSQSSRSHTVFTIVVHIKENSPKGEELVKIGKLNLVDLAGSENISKAGSDNPAKKERARECVNINQSLLTLGRVITALVEKHPHIPYRESKLTRILQESLGGRTKTSIIATISPGHKDLEETMSTLEYANRAKNIQNKPEVNQKLTKQAILKEFAEEVDKLKRELTAARDKNGVYLPTETYEEMTIKHDEQRREIQELLLKKRAMEEERERMESVFRELEQQHARVETDLMATRDQLQHTASKLEETSQRCEEQKHLVSRHLQTEGELTAQARQLIAAADVATNDVASLHDTVDRRRTVESANVEAVNAYRAESTAQRQNMLSGLQGCTETYMAARDQLQANIDDHARDTSMTQELNIQDMKLLAAKMAMFMNEIKSLSSETESQLSDKSAQCQSVLESSAAERRRTFEDLLAGLIQQVAESVDRAAATDVVGTVSKSTEQWLQGATSRVHCLQRTHSTFNTQAKQLENTRDAAARRRHAARLAALKEEEDTITACIEQMERDKQAIEERMAKQLAVIQEERDATEQRLQEMAQHVETVRTALHENTTRHLTELQQQRQAYEQSTQRCLQLQRSQLDCVRRERAAATAGLEETCEESNQWQRHVTTLDKEFGEGTSAITAEMEAFSHSVVQIVAHTNDKLMAELSNTKTTIEQAVGEVSQADAAATRRHLQGTRDALHDVVLGANNTLAAVVNKTEETTSSSLEAVNTVSERCSRLASSALQQQTLQTATLARATDAVQAGGDNLRREINQQADMEGRYLMQEFRVYSPTGNTPARREYRYPRRLAATSPHERILQRFRLQPRNSLNIDSPESDCIVVESDEGRNGSDSDEVSESSVSNLSEDSGVAQQ